MSLRIAGRSAGELGAGLRRRVERLSLTLSGAPSFQCPCCDYSGPFFRVPEAYGVRERAKCPRCEALERHRLQFCVLTEVLAEKDFSGGSVLHMAPERIIRKRLEAHFAYYTPADIEPYGDLVQADLRCLPFADGSFDLVYASHVLEHVDDDENAISEIRRVLRPSGIAILPVPIVAERTVEYPHAVPQEHYHVRAPGPDYYDRYARHFGRIELRSSADYPENYQLYIHEDRTIFPNASGPFRPPMAGLRHKDVVPICYA